MRSPSPIAWLLVCSALLTTIACGGGGRRPTPTAPVPDTPCQAETAAAPSFPIINGTACDAMRSSVVMLKMRYDESGAFAICSGTVIASRAVLTAAHCLVQRPLDVTVVRGGVSDVVSQSYVVHPGYNRNERYPLDVALVRTDQDLSRAAVPVLVGRAATIGERALLSGWGRDQAGNSGTLRAGTGTVDFVGETFFTTRNSEQNGMLCSGDSGGPVLLSQNGGWTLAGVAYETIYTGANTPLCESGISVYASTNNGSIASFLRTEVPDAVFR